MTRDDLLAILRERAREYGGASAIAREGGVSKALVSLVLAGKEPLGPKLARALGYRPEITYVPLHSVDESVKK